MILRSLKRFQNRFKLWKIDHFNFDTIHTKCDFKIVFYLSFSYHRTIGFETRFIRLDQLVNEGNLRPVNQVYVNDLLSVMISSGIDPAYPIQVMAPIQGAEVQTYRIINGQHRFEAARSYFNRMDPIPARDQWVINCQIYSNITAAEEASIAANPIRTQITDQNNVTFRRCVLYLDYFKHNPNDRSVGFSNEQFGRIYSSAENASSNWIRQCLRAVKFPCVHPENNPQFFSNIQLQNDAFRITGMSLATVNGIEDPSRVYFGDLGLEWNVEQRLTSPNDFQNAGGYLTHLHQKIMFNQDSYTMSGYTIIYTTLCNGINKILYPTQIITILEEYLAGLERLVNANDDVSAYNKTFTGFAAILSEVFSYLYSLVNIGTTSLPILPAEWSYPEGNFGVEHLITADLYQIFVLLMNSNDLPIVKSNLWRSKQNKAVAVQAFFMGNIGSSIRDRWTELFRNPESIMTSIPTDVFGDSPHFQEDYKSGNGSKYTLKFFNSCVFSFCSKAKANGLKYNLVLGDIPVSLICFYWYP